MSTLSSQDFGLVTRLAMSRRGSNGIAPASPPACNPSPKLPVAVNHGQGGVQVRHCCRGLSGLGFPLALRHLKRAYGRRRR
jgi:hypothetical protein